MIALLDHNYNCYDQIEFIVKQVCTNRIANDNERLIEYFIRMIVNEKQLVQAMGKWIDLNSFQMLQRAMKTEVDYSRRKIIGKCKICQRSIERVNIRQARQQILCEGIGEDIFEQEFMYTKEQFESQPVVVQSAPMTTITYLSKTIQEM